MIVTYSRFSLCAEYFGVQGGAREIYLVLTVM